MFRIILLIGILSCATQLNAQNPDCERFRNGKFYYPSVEHSYSVRKDAIQESYTNDQLEAIWDVKWLDDCTLELTLKKIVGTYFKLKKGDRVVARILETNDDCLTVESQLILKGGKELEPVTSEMCKDVN